ncbi:hypothetical protein AsAng_0057130 [Aureispira anguillae]|uniref:Uncharacterized protein n=1 Tax=Aureispira anguillae TaxID=2864201 RepID=A0A916DVZ8_9BACT|nr:hypothetical protein AsAng_0057130 [Aureispira anguillae]
MINIKLKQYLGKINCCFEGIIQFHMAKKKPNKHLQIKPLKTKKEFKTAHIF